MVCFLVSDFTINIPGRTVITDTPQHSRPVHVLQSVDASFDLLSYYNVIKLSLDEMGSRHGTGESSIPLISTD